MPLPGTSVITRESPPSRAADIDTSTWHVVGFTERGPSDRAVLCRNFSQVQAVFGERSTGYTTLMDALETYFRDGGSRAVIGRMVGPDPTVATVTLQDSTPADTLRIDAIAPGVWYDAIDIDIVAGTGAGQFRINVLDGDGETLESSPDLNDKTEAVAWADNSAYIRAVDLGAGNDPVVGSFDLVGGDDDKANATDAERQAALALITKDFGPGQVSAPGYTTGQAHQDLLDHAEANNRHALLDLPDTATVGTLTAAVTAAQAHPNEQFGSAWAPWVKVAGLAAGTTRTVPYSAIQAALIARSEANGNSPNVPAAGDNGVSQVAIDVTQTWDDNDRQTLNEGGVNVAIYRDGAVRTYGYRTLVNQLLESEWGMVSNVRLGMAIAALADDIAERYMFAQLDGRGRKVAEFGGDLTGMLLPFYNAGSLYGETFQDAAKVDVSEQVNPPEDLAQGILRAVIAVRMSPFAERVIIEITKVANTEVIA